MYLTPVAWKSRFLSSPSGLVPGCASYLRTEIMFLSSFIPVFTLAIISAVQVFAQSDASCLPYYNWVKSPVQMKGIYKTTYNQTTLRHSIQPNSRHAKWLRIYHPPASDNVSFKLCHYTSFFSLKLYDYYLARAWMLNNYLTVSEELQDKIEDM